MFLFWSLSGSSGFSEPSPFSTLQSIIISFLFYGPIVPPPKTSISPFLSSPLSYLLEKHSLETKFSPMNKLWALYSLFLCLWIYWLVGCKSACVCWSVGLPFVGLHVCSALLLSWLWSEGGHFLVAACIYFISRYFKPSWSVDFISCLLFYSFLKTFFIKMTKISPMRKSV